MCAWLEVAGSCMLLICGNSSEVANAMLLVLLPLRHLLTQLCSLGIQGWGNWFNTMVLVVLLAAFGENKAPYNQKQLGDVWRISYGIGLIPIIIMLVWRVFFLRVRNAWAQ